MSARVKEAAIIRGTVGNFFRVDSEHGTFNGWFSPKIVYDLYIRVPGEDYPDFVAWITKDTVVYEQSGGSLKQVPFDTIKSGDQVQVYVRDINRPKDAPRPEAYALKIVIQK